MNQDLLYRIGLTLLTGVGHITARQILQSLDDLSLLFQKNPASSLKIPGLLPHVMEKWNPVEALRRAEQEIAFLEKHNITPLFIHDAAYPRRLRDHPEAPLMLYFKGNADLNSLKIISIVGTRNADAYGRSTTEDLVKDIARLAPGALIVSGLAYGIDIYAHRAALKNNLPTVGVLGHGLDRIYPLAHKDTAVAMLEGGGLLSDFLSGTFPEAHNFVRRNRIVACMADCTVVVQSAAKGGALITARIAASCNRDVFAVPGRVSDPYSAGCNHLIRSKTASLIAGAEDIFKEMGWDETVKKRPAVVHRSLFPDLSEEEQAVIALLDADTPRQLNVLCVELGQPVSRLTAVLFELEMKGVVGCLPGGMYRLV